MQTQGIKGIEDFLQHTIPGILLHLMKHVHYCIALHSSILSRIVVYNRGRCNAMGADQ